MVGNVAEMFARMKKIDRLFVRLKPFKKCPVIGCGVGDSDEPKVGSHFPNVGDLFRDLCFQRYLASFRPKCLQAIAVCVMETDRSARRPAWVQT